MISRDKRLFFRSWLKAPLKTGVPIPSGRALALAMAGQINVKSSGIVVELGGGTGIVTEALLKAGLRTERLVIVERNPALHQLLLRRFPGVRVLLGDAAELSTLLKRPGITKVETVVSSLPLLSLPPAVSKAILNEIFGVLEEEGALMQYTYGMVSPIRKNQLAQYSVAASPVKLVWKNFPPARVWRYSKNEEIQSIMRPRAVA